MIYMREMTSDFDGLACDHRSHLTNLHHRLNLVRRYYQRPMVVTSGFRSKEDHYRIYRAKGVTNPPMGSQHLIGAAADIADPDGAMKSWIVENLHHIEEAGLWMESFEATGGIEGGWIHFQLYPPRSGNRFFNP